MISLNCIHVMGYCGGDAELKYTPGGDAVLSFSICQTDKWKLDSGEVKERQTWFRCQIWGKRAEALVKMIRKGSALYVQGSIRTREYEDKEGIKRYAWDVHVRELNLLNKKPETAGARGGDAGGFRDDGGLPDDGGGFADDDIPF